MKKHYTQAETDAFFASRLYVLTAKARFNYRGQVVVDWCPYCGEQHHHDLAVTDDLRQRAGCNRSDYILDFS